MVLRVDINFVVKFKAHGVIVFVDVSIVELYGSRQIIREHVYQVWEIYVLT